MSKEQAPRGVVLPMRRVALAGYLGALAVLPVAAALGWLVDGGAGVWGAVLGLAVPVGFLSVTVLVALGTARMAPTALGAAVLGSWLIKICLLIAVLAVLGGADFYSRGVFFATFLVGVAGYLAVEAVIVVRTRVPYVEPRPPS